MLRSSRNAMASPPAERAQSGPNGLVDSGRHAPHNYGHATGKTSVCPFLKHSAATFQTTRWLVALPSRLLVC